MNEIYGQTEAICVVGNCGELWPTRPGAMGRAYPGHDVQVDDGEIVVPIPSHFSGTGTILLRPRQRRRRLDPDRRSGRRDDDGYFWFEGRVDDVISSAGYHMAEGQCVVGHPSVKLAAVIGVPDDTRGEIIKAFVVLRDGRTPTDALAGEIQSHVRERLAAYEERPRQSSLSTPFR